MKIENAISVVNKEREKVRTIEVDGPYLDSKITLHSFTNLIWDFLNKNRAEVYQIHDKYGFTSDVIDNLNESDLIVYFKAIMSLDENGKIRK